MAFKTEIWERAKLLVLAGYSQGEIESILALEYTFDEFQLEDLPALVRHQIRYWSKYIGADQC